MAAKQGLDHWIRRSLERDPPRSKSLIMTIFGDSLRPYVPGVWLSELNGLLAPFDVNAQLTRTSAFRLAEEGWLHSEREGRRSFYALTQSGKERMQHADQRIYRLPTGDWDGSWTLVMMTRSQASTAAWAELRKELEWEGFGMVAPGIFAHPRANRANLNEVLRRLNLAGDAVVFHARDLEGVATNAGRKLADELWNCARVGESYGGFVERFKTVEPLLGNESSPEAAFVAQTLLIHAFRRVVLHDPQLPAALLPKAWPGHAAYELCRSIYAKTYLLTRSFLALQVGSSVPPGGLEPASSFYERLGGLRDVTAREGVRGAAGTRR